MDVEFTASVYLELRACDIDVDSFINSQMLRLSKQVQLTAGLSE
jgi:hypothetical protein